MGRKHFTVAEHIKVGKLPSMKTFRAWKLAVFQNVNAASGRDDSKAPEWMMELDDPEKDIEYFAEYSGRFNQLDLRLGADLMTSATAKSE